MYTILHVLRISLHSLVWHPAPPKFSLHPTTVKRFLFPNYKGLSKEERRKIEEKPDEEDDLARRLRLVYNCRSCVLCASVTVDSPSHNRYCMYIHTYICMYAHNIIHTVWENGIRVPYSTVISIESLFSYTASPTAMGWVHVHQASRGYIDLLLCW